MSTLKTVLITTAVLVLGSVIGFVLWGQQQSIDTLNARVYLLSQQVVEVQNRTDENASRLNRTIKRANKNFSEVKDREDSLESIVKIIAKIIVSSASPETSPSTFTQSKGM